MEEAIRTTVLSYLDHYYNNDYKSMLGLLEEEELNNYVEKFVDFAFQMDRFGESEDFLKRIDVQDLEALQQLSTSDFMLKILALTKQQFGKKEIKRIIKGIVFNDITIHGDQATVIYTMPLYDFDEDGIKSSMKLIQKNEDWRIHFSSRLDSVLA
ncbi:MAG: hypothetical protein AAGK97_18520, partial [Bacteroidota bacterium]